MAIRVEQTPLVLETAYNTGHLRVGQTVLVIEDVPPPIGHLRVEQTVLVLEINANDVLPTLTGTFQDPLGNPYALGTFSLQLSTDATTTLNTIVSSKSVVTQGLDSTGSIIQPFYVWPNGALTIKWNTNPLITGTNTFYIAKVMNAEGQLVWQTQFSFSTASNTYSMGSVIPQS